MTARADDAGPETNDTSPEEDEVTDIIDEVIDLIEDHLYKSREKVVKVVARLGNIVRCWPACGNRGRSTKEKRDSSRRKRSAFRNLTERMQSIGWMKFRAAAVMNPVHLRLNDGRLVEVPQGQTTMGRSTENRIVMKREAVSRFHALLEREADTVWITDLNSSNGTYINEVRLEKETRRLLNHGDRVGEDRQRTPREHLRRWRTHRQGNYPEFPDSSNRGFAPGVPAGRPLQPRRQLSRSLPCQPAT